MGMIKQLKENSLAVEARRAVQEGRTVFAPRINTPMTQHSFTGTIAGWAEMIEAVENEGWTLTNWEVTNDTKGRPEAYPLFRRRA